jgi:hypothetical protein
MKTSGYDCVTIPGAVINTNDMNAAAERICGRQFVKANEGTAAMAKTICSEFFSCINQKS